MAKTANAKIQNPLRAGNTVHIRTVTHYYVARIALVADREIILHPGASWVAWPNETFGVILATGKVSDSQLIPYACAIGRGAIVDVIDWPHPLPTSST